MSRRQARASLRLAFLAEDEAIDSVGEAFFVVGRGDIPGRALDVGAGVAHGDARAGVANISTSLGMSPITAIWLVGTPKKRDATRTTVPLFASR